MKLEELIEELQDIKKLYKGEIFIDSFSYFNGRDSQIKIQEMGKLHWHKLIYRDTNPTKEMVTIND